MQSFGLLKSPPDVRDYIYTDVVEKFTTPLPDTYLQWIAYSTPVEYQADLGACAAFSSGAVAELLNTKELKRPVILSEQFIYNEAKKIDGAPDEEGTYLRAVLSVLKHVGVCEESFLPYESKYPPSKEAGMDAFTNAAKYKIKSYASVLPELTQMKQAIVQKGPLLTGINVYENFETIDDKGIASSPSGALKGQHAIPILGYDELGFIIKNSWSIYWGKDGYCTIPYGVWPQITLGEVWSIIDASTPNKIGVLEYIKCFFRKRG
jgi:C1A family cysteine protease